MQVNLNHKNFMLKYFIFRLGHMLTSYAIRHHETTDNLKVQ